jgi:hypothetical protein
LRQIILRHPEIILKSWASYEAKINYYSRTLNRPIRNEELFPLFLAFNYNAVIRPRIECLRDQGLKTFQLSEILPCSEEEFCLRFSVDSSELANKKAQRKVGSEKDIMWKDAQAI